MAEISAFWTGSRDHARHQQLQAAGGLDLTTAALLALLLLGALDPTLWRAMPEAPFLIGLSAAMICLGLAQPGFARVRSIVLAMVPGLALTLGEAVHLGHSAALGTALYLAGSGMGALVIGSERWLPALGRIGDKSRILGFAARWQAIVAAILIVHFLLLLAASGRAQLTDLLHGEVAGLLALTLLHFARIAKASAPGTRAKMPLHFKLVLLLGGLVVGLQLLWILGVIPKDWSATASVVLFIGSMPALIIFGVLRGALAVAVIQAALTGAVLTGLAQTSDLWPDEAANLGLVIILFTLVSLAARLGDWGASQDSASTIVETFQDKTGSWLARLDFDTKQVTLPLMASEQRRSLSFASFFQASDPARLLDFMSRVESRSEEAGIDPETDHALLRVSIPGAPTHLVKAMLLSATSGHAWLALNTQGEHADLSTRLEQAETTLAMMRVREERLLSVASHEMRTPVSILTMLAEELKSGADWREVEFSFETTLNRLTGILDDLRVAGEGSGSAGTFTLNELSEQVLDAFHGAALAQGISIRRALSQHARTPLLGDPARIIIALSKVVHNAIVHSQGKVVVLGAMLAQKSEQAGQVSWFVSDDGIGIAPDLEESLFDPFTSQDEAGLGTGHAAGLGLYTARKALRLMGGDIELKRTGEVGSEFVITHPVRIAVAAENGANDQMNNNEKEIAYPDKTVLLVEDNKLVGELTASRLRRLFGSVHWAETGTDGLEMFQHEHPDILLIDQLLPGMAGNELIEQVRLAEPKLPIIGVTASTMGSECELLEAAGANIAVEKPLSFSQLQVLVADFLGAARQS